jgi:hypothetical protein
MKVAVTEQDVDIGRAILIGAAHCAAADRRKRLCSDSDIRKTAGENVMRMLELQPYPVNDER